METLDNPSYFSLPTRCPDVRSISCRTSSSSLPRGANMGVAISSSQPSPTRRSFRSLFRTLSGGPTRSSSQPLHVLNKKAPSVTSETSEAETDFSSTDMMYYNLPTPPLPMTNKSRTLSEHDELPPRYYHNLGTSEGRRRHSIGAFYREKPGINSPFHRLDVNANAVASTSKLLELPTPVRRPSAERWLQQGARRKCHAKVTRSSPAHLQLQHHQPGAMRATGAMTPANEIDDILIISHQHSQVGNLWVNYISSCFEQICKQRKRTPFRIQCVGLDELGGAVPLAMEERMVRVKLQLVIICPSFLQRLTEQPDPSSSLTRLLQPDRVLAMLLGVTEDSITEEQRAALSSYSQWRRMPVRDQDPTFVGEFLNDAMTIFSRVTSEQQAARQEQAFFSVLPKKVKNGHNKVIVLLNEPLEKEDKIRVTVNKNGEILEVPSVKRRNQFTLQFTMPDACLAVSMLVAVRVEKNGEPLGSRQIKCESRMRELDQLLRSTDNPLDFMCQTLGFGMGDREQLDTFMVTAFQRNLPPHFNLFHTHPSDFVSPLHARKNSSPEEFPTLLHFAARHGLEKLAWQLLECPGGEQACEIRNGAELTAADVAEAAGHVKLANALRGYMQMNEFTSMYCYLKMASEGRKPPPSPSIASSDTAGDEYHLPRPLNETYQVPPAARPVRPALPTPVETPEEVDGGGYLEMLPSTSPGGRTQIVTTGTNSLKRGVSTPQRNGVSNESYSLQLGKERRTPPPLPRGKESESPSSKSSDEDSSKRSTNSLRKRSREKAPGPQDELVEIINDFKNNVFTISEVEKLVENWKTRNDVQQSFKEKQDQLVVMREQYEMIQAKMKEALKRPTPFDKFKNFFKGKSKDSKDMPMPGFDDRMMTMNTMTPDISLRPASSLSLHSISSSSSSERMSTMSQLSGCSLGDSGTHSDNEERKSMAPPLIPEDQELPQRQRIHNYEVPPAPRPVLDGRNRPKLQLSTSDSTLPFNRPPMPTPRPGFEEEIDSYYITFNKSQQSADGGNSPSSSVPEQLMTPNANYMNYNSPTEAPMHSYMNLGSTVGPPPPVPPRVPARNME